MVCSARALTNLDIFISNPNIRFSPLALEFPKNTNSSSFTEILKTIKYKIVTNEMDR